MMLLNKNFIDKQTKKMEVEKKQLLTDLLDLFEFINNKISANLNKTYKINKKNKYKKRKIVKKYVKYKDFTAFKNKILKKITKLKSKNKQNMLY